jgi:predicted nucleotidyltransferase
VFFFGSRVRGDNFERADIDLGIEGPEEVSARIMLEIKEELENIRMLYKIDLVDFKTVSEKFKKEALKYIEYVK